MTLKDLMADDVSTVFLNTDEHAIDLTYTVKDGSPVDIKGIFDTAGIAIDYSDDSASTRDEMVELTISRNSTTGIANPEENDSFVVDSKTYQVTAVMRQDADMATLAAINKTDETYGQPRQG